MDNKRGEQNRQAWGGDAYQAWVKRFGTPESYAERLKGRPETVVAQLLPYMGTISGKRILNMMGSNGNKAVALALMGAAVTVVDYSEENKAYALDLAEACGVHIDYVVSDVLQFTTETHFDIAFAEMGILHYFDDLVPFFDHIKGWLVPGGKCLIRDFHPVSTKLIQSRGSTAKVRKHKVSGDYFSTELIEKRVAFDKYLTEEGGESVYLRFWTLGEIVTAAAMAGLRIEGLWEAPNQSSESFDPGIPKTFTLLASRSE